MSIDINREVLATIEGLVQMPPDQQLLVAKYVRSIRDRQAEIVTSMDETMFWDLISSLSTIEEEREKTLDALTQELALMSSEAIYAFQDILSEKLSMLDTPEYWEVGGGSSDGFLYARCYVVSKGKDYYESILSSTETFPSPPFNEFEEILYIPYLAYELKTGEELTRVPKFNYESRSNTANWGGEALKI